MSVLNQSGEEQVECPLCMEPLEVDDLHFYPCTCGYQICRFCWNRIREGENGLCPACRKAYPENPADFTPLSQEQVAAIKTEKKAREAKRRNKTLESRRALANVRVVQNNLVFVVGLPVRLADPEILKRQEYFGKYGKIHKVVINQSTTYAGSQGTPQGPSASAYVTYVTPADALRAIQGVNNVALDGRVLKGSLGTTKYCANFMKNQPCPKPDCMYLHELGDPKASFTKEEMHAGLHQVYERKLHNQLLQATRHDDKIASAGNSSTTSEKGTSKEGNPSNFIPTTVVTSSNINVVNSTKSKKTSESSSNGTNSGSGSSVNGENGKEAWPSLGSSPPAHSPAHKNNTVKSQENGTSESSSPTQTQPAPSKQKENTDSKHNRNNKDSNSTNTQTKKSKNDSKSKQKNGNSININTNANETSETETSDTTVYNNSTQSSSVFESNAEQSYLSNEIDELESDRHSLLENHDLLDHSDHSLLDDDNTHNLLSDASNEVLMMQRHRDMMAGLVDSNIMKSQLVNGYGMLDRDVGFLGNDRHNQISQVLLDQQKELMLRERSRSELLMRHNDMLSRSHNLMEPKHYMPTSSIGLESASELLGANYHSNPNAMLPPFGMRVDNSLTNSMGNNMVNGAMGNSTLGNNSMGNGNMVNNSMGNSMVNSSLGNSLINSTLGSSMVNNSLVNSMVNNTLGNSMVNNTLGNSMVNNTLGSSMVNNSLANSMVNNSLVNSMVNNTLGSSMVNNSLGNSMVNNTMGSSMVNAMGNSMVTNSMANSMVNNAMGNAMVNGIGNGSMGSMTSMGSMGTMGSGYMAGQAMRQGRGSGFDSPQSAVNNEGRYLAENMDKFFTDFHKTQQMRMLLSRNSYCEAPAAPRAMLSAERLEMEHKRMSSMASAEAHGARAAGDGDDDLDFDPIKETQKAFEMMETEMMQNNVCSGDSMDRVRRVRVPPGFQHVTPAQYAAPPAPAAPATPAAPAAPYPPRAPADWTQMDPAIMSTSVSFNKPQFSQQELLARVNQLGGLGGVKLQWPAPKPWAPLGYGGVPLPPGFAPPQTHPADAIDAK